MSSYKRGKRADMTPKAQELARIYDRLRKEYLKYGFYTHRKTVMIGVKRALDAVADNDKLVATRVPTLTSRVKAARAVQRGAKTGQMT